MRRVLSSLAVVGALLCPWTASAQTAPTNCSVPSQNLYVRDVLNSFYYWYQNRPANVSPTSYASPEAYLDAVRYRPIDNSFSYITSAAAKSATRASVSSEAKASHPMNEIEVLGSNETS